MGQPSQLGEQAEEALREISEAKPPLSEEQRTAAQIAAHDHAKLLIAQIVIWLYVGIVVALALAYLGAAWSVAGADHAAAAADKVRDLANTLVLPIVTLVLGYYFGTRA